MLVAALLGVVLGFAVGTVDTATGWTFSGPVDNARTAGGAMVTSIVTLAVFSLWMRSVVAGLMSSQISPRIVANFLDDAFQWRVLTGMAAAFTFVVTLLVQLPASDAPDGIPALSTVLSMTVVLLALVTVLASLRMAVERMSLPEIIARLTSQAQATLADDSSPNDPDPGRAGGSVERVHARAAGWVTSVDRRGVVEALPPGTQLTLRVDVGVFVGPDDVLAAADDHLPDDVAGRVRRGIVLRPFREPSSDLGFALQQLRDIGQRAMGGGATDTSTGHECLLNLRTVLAALIDRGVRTGHLQGPDGRLLIASGRWSVCDHLREVLEPLVHAVTGPVETRYLAMVLDDLAARAAAAGDADSEELLRHQLPAHLGGGPGDLAFDAARRPDGRGTAPPRSLTDAEPGG